MDTNTRYQGNFSQTHKTKLGGDHPKTLATLSNQAYAWYSKGRVAEAIDLMETCIYLALEEGSN